MLDRYRPLPLSYAIHRIQTRTTQCFGLALLLLITAGRAGAEFPYPANPAPCLGHQVPPVCFHNTDFASFAFLPSTEPPTVPNDFGNNNWKLTSGKTGDPVIDADPRELFGVRGASVDRAWQVSTGRPDVVIAVLDSGIRWQDRLTDLVNKFYLHRAELPVPEGSTNDSDPWDRNGDGVFNVRDYLADATHAQDPRVTDQNGNQLIDPEDLIFLFSDGVDDDQNGYIDDISGWDFFEDDNDALDEVRYGHGTGESEDSGAEANNADGEVGTCPNCLLLSLRVGDSFVAEVNNFAQAVYYAVDAGALVVQEALGTLNNSDFAQAAVDYAYAHGVTVVASAADEQSNHHNYPANYRHTLEVNSVTHFLDAGEIQQTPRSYLYLNGCTNYGGHIALSVPSSACSSEATGRSSGMVGLLYSAAWNEIDRGNLAPYRQATENSRAIPLSANEVKQILTLTADDIDFEGHYETMTPFPGVQMSQRFPSIAGWDQYFGYGRINADSALRRLATGKIPPEADVTSPEWFEILDPDGPLTVTADVAATRAESYSYRVEAAPGIQPYEADMAVVAMGTASEPMRIEADLSSLVARMPHGVEGPAIDASGQPDPDRFTVTVRVTVIDQQGNHGEDRRVFAIHRDPQLRGGRAHRLGGDGVASPVLADVDGNGIDDVVLATSDGRVHAFTGGIEAELPGWPVATDAIEIHSGAKAFARMAAPRAAILGRPAVGDLDGDGVLEVVATDVRGFVYVWNHDGTRRPGFPVGTHPDYSHTWRSERDLETPEGQVPDRINRRNRDNRVARGFGTGPVLVNLDGSSDGSLEIIAGAWDRHVYAWHADGTAVRGWPVLLKDPTKVAAVDPTTAEITLTATARARIGSKIISPPSVGDIDGDGTVDVVVGVNEGYIENPNAYFSDLAIALYRAGGILTSGNGRLYAIGRDGTARGDTPVAKGWNPQAYLPGWPVRIAMLTTELLPFVGTGINGAPALADLDADGSSEIGIFSFLGPAYVLNGAGKSWLGDEPTRRGIPRTLAASVLGTASNSIDAPAFPGLGGGVLAPFAGIGNGYHFLAPTAGLGKLLDNNIPADQIPSENQFSAWLVADAQGEPAAGTFLEAFPRVVNDLQFLTSPSVADLDNDGLPEALEGTGVYDVHAFNVHGVEAPGWPKFTNGWTVTTPAVGDIDGDGLLEVVSATREGWLFVWESGGEECSFIPWRMNHHDAHSTGNAATDDRAPAAPVAATARLEAHAGGVVTLELPSVPGDDLYCGDAAQLDVRYASAAIENLDDFAAATSFAEQSRPAQAGRQVAGTYSLRASRPFAPGMVYVAARSFDEAGNRSTLVHLGTVDLQPDPSPTTTSTPTASATATPTPTVTTTNTPTSTASATATYTETTTPTATSTHTSTATATASGSGGSCAIDPTPPAPAHGLWLLAVIAMTVRSGRRRPFSGPAAWRSYRLY